MGLPWREVLFLCICCFSLSLAQKENDYCCQANLMQSMGRTVIERDYQIVQKSTTVQSVRVRQCVSLDDMYIQFWEFMSSSAKNDSYKLVLTLPKLRQDGVGNLYKADFDRPITILPTWRLGFKGPAISVGNSGNGRSPTIPIPYYFNDKYKAIRSLHSKEFEVNREYNFTKITWPVSFTQNKPIIHSRTSLNAFLAPNIMFCTQKGCPGLSNSAPFTNTIVSGPAGPPGPPGPSGPSGSSGTPNGKCTCKNSKAVTDVENMGQKQGQMQKTLENIRTLVAQLSRGNQPTGKCPDGFTQGTYGVGSCYLYVQQRQPVGVAQISCQERGARLLRIETSLEHRFLLDSLSTIVDSDKPTWFWTAGLWSKRTGKWVWHEEKLDDETQDLKFQNWYPGEAVVNINGGPNMCLALQVSKGSQLLWFKKACPTSMYYVCEAKKECM